MAPTSEKTKTDKAPRAKVTKSRDDVRTFFLTMVQARGAIETVLKTQEPVLTATQWAILAAVKEEPCRPAQLANSHFQSRQAIQRAARKLETDGLVRSDKIDGKKAVNLAITDQGRDLLDRIDGQTQEIADRLNEKVPALNLANQTKSLKRAVRGLAIKKPKAAGGKGELSKAKAEI